MNRMALLLCMMTLVSGSATVYYANALKQERARSTQRTPVYPAQDTHAHTSAVPAGTAPPATSPQPVGRKPASGDGAAKDIEAMLRAEQEAERRDPGELAVARYRLEKLRDPKEQVRATAEYAQQMRDMLGQIAPHIGLSPGDIDRLVEATSDDGLENQRRTLECRADPDCDVDALAASFEKTLEEEAARLLGAEKLARYKTYMDATEERIFLQALRNRLAPGKSLTDSEIEAMSLALAEERRNFDTEAEARKEKVETLFGGVRSAAIPGSAGEYEQRLKSATQYFKRRSERAGELLGDAQLSVFNASQERELAIYRSMLNEQAIAAAARKAAGTEQKPALP